MKGLLRNILALLSLIVGVNAGETIQITYRLPTYPQEDRDLVLVQKFLLFLAGEKIDVKGYEMMMSPEGEVVIEGNQDNMETFSLAFVNWMKVPIREETFEQDKASFLGKLGKMGDLDEREIAEEISWEAAMVGAQTLSPLEKMLLCSASALAEKPQLIFVSTTPNYHHYYNLPISEDHQQSISKLIRKMADSGYWELLKVRKEMDKLGDKVMPIHPLRFIGHIYGDPNLKKRMPKILDDIFKRRGFLNGHGKKEGFAQRMTKEANNNNLMQYLPGFTQSLGITQSSIEPYFHRHDWEGLLRHLCK